MTTHTLQFRDVLKFNGDDFMKLYPIFDEAHRDELNQMIKDEYWLREIAHETDSIFMHRFKTVMNREMPTFNELYRVAQREIDPFITMSLKTNTENETDATRNTATTRDTETDATRSGTSLTTSETSGDSETTSEKASDNTTNNTGESHSLGYVFPANQIEQRKDYANTGSDADSTTVVAVSGTEDQTSSTATSESGTLEGTESETSGSTAHDAATAAETSKANDVGMSVTEGYQGMPGDLLRNYRENVMNVDAMIVKMLSRLFLGIWSTNAPLI